MHAERKLVTFNISTEICLSWKEHQGEYTLQKLNSGEILLQVVAMHLIRFTKQATSVFFFISLYIIFPISPLRGLIQHLTG